MKKILIVESDMDYAIKTGIYWGRKGFNPIFAFSIREAMAEIRTEMPVIIFISKDLRDGKGTDFLRKIRTEGFDLPIVIRRTSENGEQFQYDLNKGATQIYKSEICVDRINHTLDKIMKFVKEYFYKNTKMHNKERRRYHRTHCRC